MAAPTTGLTIIKRFTYRGVLEEWSNHYWLTGPTPSNATEWRALFDAVANAEAGQLLDVNKIIKGYGYDSTDEHAAAVWTVDLRVAPNTLVSGTWTGSGGSVAPGDSAVWVRWGLDKLNSKGKRVYLRKYFHPAVVQPAPNTDQLVSQQVTGLTTFGGKMRDGTLLGGRVVTDKQGTPVLGAGVSTYATTRTLKRRGKRPPT